MPSPRLDAAAVAGPGAALAATRSLCPTCLREVAAELREVAGAVELHKTCPEHGPQRVRVWPDVEHYRWITQFQVPPRPVPVGVQATRGCPRDCGLCEHHRRPPTLVEVEITQRCNLRCPVCFVAAADAPPDPSPPTLEGMFRAVLAASGPGVGLQLTGGEPTVRRDLPEIVRLARRLGFESVEVNTNGVRLGREPGLAAELAAAGVSGVYLQFDGLRDDVYRAVRGRALVAEKLAAIERCRAAGVQVVLAMTVIAGLNDDQLGEVLDFALGQGDVVAGLAYQPAFTSGRFDVAPTRRLGLGDVAFLLGEQSGGRVAPYDLWPLGTSHPLCSAATYLVGDGGDTVPLTRLITPQAYVEDLYDPTSPQGSVFPDIAARLGYTGGLSVVVMNYMDAAGMDLDRLAECSMVVTLEDGRLIPFCAYQTSDLAGARLYPTWGRPPGAPGCHPTSPRQGVERP